MAAFQTPARTRAPQSSFSRSKSVVRQPIQNPQTTMKSRPSNATSRSKSVGPKSRQSMSSSASQKELTIPKPFSFASEKRSRRKSDASNLGRDSDVSSRSKSVSRPLFSKTPAKEFKTPARPQVNRTASTTVKSITKPKEFTFASSSRSRKSISSQQSKESSIAPRSTRKPMAHQSNSKISGTSGLPRVHQKKDLCNAPVILLFVMSSICLIFT